VKLGATIVLKYLLANYDGGDFDRMCVSLRVARPLLRIAEIRRDRDGTWHGSEEKVFAPDETEQAMLWLANCAVFKLYGNCSLDEGEICLRAAIREHIHKTAMRILGEAEGGAN